MNENKTNDRRNFLKTAGAALVAASVPAAVAAQRQDARPGSGNNLKQILIFGGISEPNPSLPGTYGRGCFQLQLDSVLGVGGFAVISDPVFMEINSHIQIHTARQEENYVYVFIGTIPASRNPEMIGKAVTIKVQVLSDDNCNVSLTVADTPLVGLLLPAIQKVRDKNGL